MTWQTVDTSASGSTERLKIEQGWLYRSAWRINMGIGTDMLSGSDITFVPAVHAAVAKPSQAPRQDALQRAQIEGDARRAQANVFAQNADNRAQEQMAYSAQQAERRADQGATGSPPPTSTGARVNPTPAQSTLSPQSPSGPTGAHQDAPAVREDDKASPVTPASRETGPTAD